MILRDEQTRQFRAARVKIFELRNDATEKFSFQNQRRIYKDLSQEVIQRPIIEPQPPSNNSTNQPATRSNTKPQSDYSFVENRSRSILYFLSVVQFRKSKDSTSRHHHINSNDSKSLSTSSEKICNYCTKTKSAIDFEQRSINVEHDPFVKRSSYSLTI